MYNITDNIMMRRKQMRNKSLTRFAAFFVAATMLFACLQVIAQPAANDSGYTYVLVDQPTDGGVYLMISRQSGSNFAVSGTAMPDGEGLVPVEVGVAGDYVVSGVNDSVLWQFNGSSESGYTVRNAESGEYLAKLSNTLKTSAATQHRWEHIIHTNDDSSIGDEPVMHNVTTGVGYILYRVNGDETYFDCFNAYQQCNIRLPVKCNHSKRYIHVFGFVRCTHQSRRHAYHRQRRNCADNRLRRNGRIQRYLHRDGRKCKSRSARPVRLQNVLKCKRHR